MARFHPKLICCENICGIKKEKQAEPTWESVHHKRAKPRLSWEDPYLCCIVLHWLYYIALTWLHCIMLCLYCICIWIVLYITIFVLLGGSIFVYTVLFTICIRHMSSSSVSLSYSRVASYQCKIINVICLMTNGN